MYLKVRSRGAGPALPRAQGRRTADIRTSPVSCMGPGKNVALKRYGKRLRLVEVLDDDIVAALGEVGLLAEVECVLLELCRDGGGRLVVRCFSMSAPRSGGEHRRLGQRIEAGLAAMSFTAVGASVPPMAATSAARGATCCSRASVRSERMEDSVKVAVS
eukprot:jgi/Mesvir1/14922/Mv05515-RA.1